MTDRVYLPGPPYPFGAVPRDQARAFLLSVGVDPLNLGGFEGLAYLIEMTPFDAGQTVDLPGPPYPFGGGPRRTPRATTLQGRFDTIWPACTGNAERSTSAADTPASTWVPGRLSGSFNYEIALFAGDPAAGNIGGGSGSLGILELLDPDGVLDALRTLAWDNAELLLRRGDPDALFSTYGTVARLKTAGLRSNLRRKEVVLRDLADALRQSELHGNRYGGTGGADGDAALAGRIKPLAFGACFNVPPVLINATALIYQVSCTSVLAFDAVKDGGAGLTADADYPSYAALAAVTPAAGHFATCKALGLFKLGAKPVYVVTADVRGDNDIVNGVSYPHTRAQIVRRIATARGTVQLDDPAEIDTGAFEALENWQPATLNYFFDGEVTKAQAIETVMAGCAGWWTVRLDGRLAIGQLEDPASATPAFSLAWPDDDDTVESRLDEPAMTDYAPPRRKTLMSWKKNYSPLGDNQIAGAAAADAAILQAASRWTTSEDLWVAGAYPSAPVVTVDGGFTTEADAQREGDRQRALFRTLRERFEIPAVIDPFADVVGRVAAFANGVRLGLGTSRNLFIHGVAVNANAKPILKGWG